MAWVCVDLDGEERVFEDKPYRIDDYFWDTYRNMAVSLPPGSIKKLIGRELKWEDEPVELS